MKRRYCEYNHEGRVAALICVLAGIVACGSSVAWGQATQPELLRIVYWQNEGERLPGTVDLLDSFCEKHPEIRTNLTYDRWPQAPARLRYWTHSWRDYAPDLTVIRDVWLPEYAEGCVSLEGKLSSADLQGLLPSVLDRCKVNGKLVGVPWLGASRVLYYRTDLLEAAKLKPPATLDELRQAAKALSNKEVYGLGLPAAAGGGATDVFLGLLWAMGGQAVTQGKLKLKTPEAAAALQYWVDLQREGATQPETLSWSSAELDAAFASGKLAMVFSGPSLGRYLRSQCPKLAFATAPLPAGKAAPAQLSLDVLVVLASSKHVEQGVQLLKYMLTPAAQRAMWLMGGLPTRGELLKEARQEPAQRPFVERLEQAQGLPLQETDKLTRVVERALWLALSGRVAPAEALRAASLEQESSPF